MAHIANRGLASLSEDEQFQFMDTLFEYSLELHTLMGPDLRSGSFSTYNELVDTVESKLKALSLSQSPADEQMLMKILGSHTRIGRPLPTSTSDGSKTTAEAKPISAMSEKEQNHLNVSASDKQAEMLSLLNHEYEQTFPGLRFVSFVNGRDRALILQEMRERIARRDMDQEVAQAIEATCDIAKDRGKKLQPAHV